MKILLFIFVLVFSVDAYSVNSIIVDKARSLNDHGIKPYVEHFESRNCYKVRFEAPEKYPLSEARILPFVGV